jgi:hypothetical protein
MIDFDLILLALPWHWLQIGKIKLVDGFWFLSYQGPKPIPYLRPDTPASAFVEASNTDTQRLAFFSSS